MHNNVPADQRNQAGQIRMHATKHQSVFAVLVNIKEFFRKYCAPPDPLYCRDHADHEYLHVDQWYLLGNHRNREAAHPGAEPGTLPVRKSVIMLVFFFVIIPRMRRLHFKIPMVLGFAGFVLSQLLLITIPEKGYALLLLSILLEACSTATVSPWWIR